jgi:hypothetical protein
MDIMHQTDDRRGRQGCLDRSQSERGWFLDDSNAFEDQNNCPSDVANMDRFVRGIEDKYASTQPAR